jgi:hypothetical protein
MLHMCIIWHGVGGHTATDVSLKDVCRVRAQHDHAEHNPTITPRLKNLVVGAAGARVWSKHR